MSGKGRLIKTLFNARKAKQLLRDNLKIKAKLRNQLILVDADEYEDAKDLLLKKEQAMIRYDIVQNFHRGD